MSREAQQVGALNASFVQHMPPIQLPAPQVLGDILCVIECCGAEKSSGCSVYDTLFACCPCLFCNDE